ncbi:MAG: histidine kinase, partial [Spirosoma sp.]|nr:histidine kinase [Spirosoma sp.]
DNEANRLYSLAEYQILDTLPEEVYDDITMIASQLAGTPIALLNIVDQNRQWTKARQGMDITEIPRELAFCAHAILNPDEVMVVEDARYDERFHDNPLTTGGPTIIFYAGVPIVNEGGNALGALCVIDSRPRTLPDHKLMALKALGKLVHVHFELRKTKLELSRIQDEIKSVSRGPSPWGPAVADQTQALVATIRSSVDTLLKNDPRPDQALALRNLKEAATALDVALATH